MRSSCLACISLVASTVGCGDDSAALAGGSGGATTSMQTSSSASSSAMGGGGDKGAGGDKGGGGAGGTGVRFVGGVYAVSDTSKDNGTTTRTSRAGAYFVEQTGVDHSETKTTIGPCTLEKFGSGAPPHEKDRSAGALHLTGGSQSLNLAPRANGTYAAVSQNVALWSGGETILLASDGADVPAFKTSLVAPSMITLTAPAGPFAAAGLTVPRDKPFDATWTGASSGKVTLYFDIATGNAAFALTCSFDAAAGTAEIPVKAFADLPAGQGSFNFYVLESATATPDVWTISFDASSTVVDATGAAAVGDAVFK